MNGVVTDVFAYRFISLALALDLFLHLDSMHFYSKNWVHFTQNDAFSVCLFDLKYAYIYWSE